MKFFNIIRSILFNIHFLLLTSVLVIVMLPCLFLPFWFVRNVAKLWCYILTTGMSLWLGVKIKILGNSSSKKPVIYAVKHHSAWETIICTGIFNMPSIVMKRELMFLPIIGLYFLKGGSIPITRSNNLQSLKKISKMAKRAINKGRSVLIFPQGTRVPLNSSTEDFPYLPGVYFIYSQLKIPVVPVVHNAGILWPKNSFIKYPDKVKSKTITLEILKEIPVGLEKNKFMNTLEHTIETSTNTLIKKET